MNFTQEIKRELSKQVPDRECCKLSLLSAVIGSCGKYDMNPGKESLSFTIENEDSAAFLLKLIEQVFGVSMTLSSAVRDPKHGKIKLTFSYDGLNAARYIFILRKSFSSAIERDCCSRSALVGTFLGSGSCTLPKQGTKTGYHLEFVFEEYESANLFQAVLERMQLIGNIAPRGEKYIVYLKSREGIADFLAIVGAKNSLSTLERISAAREESNNENRKNNCYAGNADKAAIASAEQVLALQKMQREGKFTYLSEPLKQTALARLSNPELSLKELAELLGVTKSCLFHRLKKLMTLV